MRAIAIAVATITCLAPWAQAAELAILPVKLLDTSGEVKDQVAAHEARLDLFTEELLQQLGTASRIPAADVAAACTPETSQCLLSLARGDGAGQALFVVVQKTSTLILQIFANLVDTESGELILSRDLNFRNDTDEAWRRAARFLSRQIAALDQPAR